MTPSPIPLQSNRELDAEIARRVFGWTGVLPNTPHTNFHGFPPGQSEAWEVPHYSTLPAARDYLIHKLTNDYGVVTVTWCDAPHFKCEIVARDGSRAFVAESEVSAAHAVCLAGLKSVESGGGQ